jgi:hypothetical protein
LRWAAAGLGLFVLSVLVAVVVSALGLLGFSSAAEDGGTRVAATVTAGAPCSKAGATETVTFKINGAERRARFDGCGHTKGEPVEILVPPGPPRDDLVVHSAAAAVGDSAPGEGLGLVFVVASGLAGAGYAFLIRRGPRGTALPPALRLVA